MKRRKVHRMVAVYAVVGVGLIEAADLIFPVFLTAQWPYRAVVTVVLAGLPIAAVLSWRFQVVPEEEETAGGDARGSATSASGVPSQPLRERGVAVLPFANLSPDGTADYFAEGMTDELIAALSRVQGLDIVPRTSVSRYRGATAGLREIGYSLGVATVVEGSVRRDGERLRIVAQAVDTRTDALVWSETYDRQLDDVFAIQSDVAARICEVVEAGLSPERAAALAHPGTEDVRAYDAYLRGRFLWNQRTESGVRASLEEYDVALERDASFALAHAARADSLLTLGLYGFAAPAHVMPAARDAAHRALALEPDLPQALAARACVAALFDWAWTDAEAGFRTVLRRDPSYATAHQWLALHVLAPHGRFDDAWAELDRATELEPVSAAILASRVVLAYFQRDYERARHEYEAARGLHPHNPLLRYFAGQCEEASGCLDAAVDNLRTAVELSGGSAEMLAALGHCRAVAGDVDGARAALRQLEERSEDAYVSPVLMAQVLMGLGRNDEALDRLEEAAELRAADLVWLAVRPVFDPLRGEPRFEALVERLGLPRLGTST